MSNNFWDRITKKYLQSIKKDQNSDFAYEALVNSLSVLSLCDNYGRALDLGCGDGRFTKMLLGRYTKVIGVDYSRELLKIAKTKCSEAKFILHDLEYGLPDLENKVDAIVCKNTLMYVKNIVKIAEDSFNLLNPGGLLIISVTHPLKWISESVKGNLNAEYLGYLSEIKVYGSIAHDRNLKIGFINRTFETYVNTFNKYGFKLETALEIGVPDSFVIKYTDYLPYQKKPYRLNLKFVKL